jgi:adenylate kinase
MMKQLPKPLTIVFLGRSGSGKGTQAEKLMKYLGEADVLYIVTGNLFRALATKESVIGRKVARELKSGELPPDWLATTLWQHELVEKLVSDQQTIFFDGALRRVPEAVALDAMLEWLGRPPVIPVLIDVTRQEAFKRLKLRQRSDDTDEAINRRLDWYDQDVIKVVKYYEELGRLKRVDGMPPPDKVFQNLLRALGISE